MKLKANNHEDNGYHLMFNNVLTSDSDLLQSNTHKGYCVLKTTDYNYKLRSVIGREDDSKITNGHCSISKYATHFYVYG